MTACLVSIALVFTTPPIEEVPQWPTPAPLASVATAAMPPPSLAIPTTTAVFDTPAPTRSTVIDASLNAESETSSPIIAPSAPPPLYPSDAALYVLRMCESTDNYSAHLVWGTQWESRATGAYQFEQPTWNGVAARHMPHLVGVRPHHASPAEQDAMARALWSERGPQPWPVCGYRVPR